MNSSADDFRTMIKPPTLLLVLSGAGQGTRIAVPLGGLVIGRGAGSDGLLGDDPALSRQHAVIVHSDRGELVVSDLGSTNGTFLNGSRVEGSLLVRPGDIIELGNTKLKAIGPSSTSSPAPAGGTPGGLQNPMTPPHSAASPPAAPAAAPAQVPAAPSAHPAAPPHPVAPAAHPAAAAAAAPAQGPVAHPGAQAAAAPAQGPAAHPAAPAAAPAPVPAAPSAHPATPAPPAASPAHPAAPAAAVPGQMPAAHPPASPARPAAPAAAHPAAAPPAAGPSQVRPQAPGSRTPQDDAMAEAVYELGRQQWRRLVSRFSTVAGYMALFALLAGLVAIVVMMTRHFG